MPSTPGSKRPPLASSRIKIKGKIKDNGTSGSINQSILSSVTKTRPNNGGNPGEFPVNADQVDQDDDEETNEDVDEADEDDDDSADFDEENENDLNDEDDLNEEDEVDEDDLDEEDEVDEDDLDEDDEVDEDDLDEEDEVDEDDLDEEDYNDEEDYDEEEEDDGVANESKVDQSSQRVTKRKSKDANDNADGHGIITQEQASEFRSQLQVAIKDKTIIDTLVDNYKEGLILDPNSYDSFLCNLIGIHRLTAEDQTVIAKIRADQLTVRDDEGHILTKVVLPGGFFCDVCGVSYVPRKIASYNCDTCDYDLCEDCYRKHAAEVRRNVAKLEDEARQKSSKWRPSKEVLLLPAKVDLCWKNLESMYASHKTMDTEGTNKVANLCRIIWQFNISNGNPLSAARAGMLIDSASLAENLPSYVAEAVCGLLSTCSKASSEDLADQILDFAEECLAKFPDSDFVAEEAVQLLIMFERDEQKLFSRLAHLTKIRSGWI